LSPGPEEKAVHCGYLSAGVAPPVTLNNCLRRRAAVHLMKHRAGGETDAPALATLKKNYTAAPGLTRLRVLLTKARIPGLKK